MGTSSAPAPAGSADAAGAPKGNPGVISAEIRWHSSADSLASSLSLAAVRGRLAAYLGAARARRPRPAPEPLPEAALPQREAGSPSRPIRRERTLTGASDPTESSRTTSTKTTRDSSQFVVSLPSGSGYSGKPPTLETDDLECLTQSQRMALRHIRRICRPLHVAARVRLAERIQKLGFDEQDLDTTLGWIRDEAPILIHLDLGQVAELLADDTHYKSQFETGSSNGTLDASRRSGWEDDLFGDAYKDAQPGERCKYGVLNATNDPKGVRACRQYGASYLQLRGTRLRTTFSAEDSAAMGAESLATVDYYAHVLEQYTDQELFATLNVGIRNVRGADSRILGRYKEAQIHGHVSLRDHVEFIMADTSLRESEDAISAVELLGTVHGVPVLWMEEGAGLPPAAEGGGRSKGLVASTADQIPDAPGTPDDDDDDLPRRTNQYRMSNSREFEGEPVRAITLLNRDDELLAEHVETMHSMRSETAAGPAREESQWQHLIRALESALENVPPTPMGSLVKKASFLPSLCCYGPRVRLGGRGRPVR